MLTKHTEPYTWLARNGYSNQSGYWKEEDLQNILQDRYEREGYSVDSEVWCQSRNGWGRADLILSGNGELVVMEVKKYLDRETIYQASMQAIMYAQNLPVRYTRKPKIEIIGFVRRGAEEDAYKTARYVQDYKHPGIREVKVTFIDCDQTMNDLTEPSLRYFLNKFLFSKLKFRLPHIKVNFKNRNWLSLIASQNAIIVLVLLLICSLVIIDREKTGQESIPVQTEQKIK